jgi:hypothetical protein
MEYKKQKIQNKKANFLGNNAASNIEKARFCKNFCFLNNRARYCLDPEPDPEPEPEPEPQ